jgi:hypothetical protein
MTLTLYTADVLSLWRGNPLLLDNRLHMFLGQVLVALVAATVWRTYVGQGPLESVATKADLLGRASTTRLRGRRQLSAASVRE